MTLFVWKGKAAVDGDVHLVSHFEAQMLSGTGRESVEMGLCGRRPRDKGPMLPAVGKPTCKGCSSRYRQMTGRPWAEPPP